MQLFNDHYNSIVEWSFGFKREKVEFDIGSGNKNEVLSSILDKQKSPFEEIHKNRNLQFSSISIPSSSWSSKVTPKEINNILKSLNSKKPNFNLHNTNICRSAAN